MTVDRTQEKRLKGKGRFPVDSTSHPKMVLHPEAGMSFGVGMVAAATVLNDRMRVSSTITTATCSPRFASFDRIKDRQLQESLMLLLGKNKIFM